jgi:antitoxin (DNA-binding transcriptional repressor) of toxin-antitoxin stability system
MKFITSKELRNNPSKLWESGAGETVVTVNGKPKAIVIGLDGDDVEEQLKSIRRAKAESALYNGKKSQGSTKTTDK